MKSISPAFQTKLDSRATTNCRCWLLTRTDGVKIGFTDHDGTVSFDGNDYEALTGTSAAAIPSNLGLNADTVDLISALSSDNLTEEDLARGYYDNASIDIFLVDWQDPSNRVQLFAGSIGEVSRGKTAFNAECRSLAHALNQPRGRLYQRACDAVLGDSRCKINLALPQYIGSGTVNTVTSTRLFTATGLGAFANRWFERGKLTWVTGLNVGASIEVRVHTNSGVKVAFDLVQAMPFAITVGDTFTVTAGCDKAHTTCIDKFANAVNFRGFPHIPGVDFITSYPVRGGNNDGGKRS